jgi:hypothetical protein
MTATRRTATAEKWAESLNRAQANGLAGNPCHWFVTSGSAPGAGYSVTIEPGQALSCGCKGAQYLDYCQHRAIVLDRLGMLPKPVKASVSVEDLAAIRERGRRAMAELFEDAA